MRGPAILVAFVLLSSAAGVARAQQLSLPAALEEPPSSAALAVLDAIPDEHTPRPERSFPVSNEFRLDLYAPFLHGLGGAVVGVGTDQNYTLAAMMGAQLVFCVDYDPGVPLVHLIYSVLVPASATRGELIAHFDEPNERATAALLAQGLAESPHKDEVVAYYRQNRAWIGRYLHRVERMRSPSGGPIAWVGDDTWYAYVQKLFRGRRVVARNGDVTGAQTMPAVGAAARRLGLTVRALYVSNADQFFDYTPQFVTNARGLPTDDRSLLLRTTRHRLLPMPATHDWHYVVEDMPDFLERIGSGHYTRSLQIVADLLSVPHEIGREGLSHITAQTPRHALEHAAPHAAEVQRQYSDIRRRHAAHAAHGAGVPPEGEGAQNAPP